MKYRLYKNSKNDTTEAIKSFFDCRGIDDYEQYLNLSDDVVIPYQNLDNIKEAVELFMNHYTDQNKMGILVDEDPDGFCSAAMMYLYIKRMDENYPVEYILHGKAKAHGLSDDVIIPEDIKLLIIPDAGTNDTEQCKELSEKGTDILILDHHEKEEDNPYALIVNNQMSANYSNKNLCGAGVVYRFLQALDEENWNEFADDYLDLCALANISDVMDMKSFETRYFVDTGLSNVQNKCFQALITAQDYSMKSKVNIHGVQWYITTILNGMIRFGSSEEKELLFKAFIEQDAFFEYKKRATKDKPAEVIQESIYDRAARLCKNAKSRQDKAKEKGIAAIAEVVNEMPFDDKVIVVDTTELLDSGLSGVTAIKVAEMFNKPCILLNQFFDKKTGKTTYGGSARNIDHSPVESLKDVINSCTSFNWGRGHANAFGINLDLDKKDEAINELNHMLKDVEYDSTYTVDFILYPEGVTVGLIMELGGLEDVIGQGLDEPMIVVENITLTKDCFEIFGSNADTISFTLNEIKYIQFKCKEGNKLYDFLQDAWDENDSITFTIVGKPSINEYNGIRTPQITIEDINVISTTNTSSSEWDEEITDEDEAW